jgi:hypothetical protein
MSSVKKEISSGSSLSSAFNYMGTSGKQDMRFVHESILDHDIVDQSDHEFEADLIQQLRIKGGG